MGQKNEIIVPVDSLSKLSRDISVINRLEIFDAGGLDMWLDWGDCLRILYQADEAMKIISEVSEYSGIANVVVGDRCDTSH